MSLVVLSVLASLAAASLFAWSLLQAVLLTLPRRR